MNSPEIARKKFVKLKPVLLMVFVQTTFGWVNVFVRLAQHDGMNLRVLIAYRYMFASCFLVPMALIFEREGRKKFDQVVIFLAILSSLLGGMMSQNFYLESLVLTTATFASAMNNLIPGITFLLAALLRMEKIGVAKVAGTLTGMAGAMILTFFKGFIIDVFPTHINLLRTRNSGSAGKETEPSRSKLVEGAMFAFANCVAFSLWLIVQSKMMKRYPYPYTATALMMIISAALSCGLGFLLQCDLSEWALGLNIRLATVAYAGVVNSGISFALMTWCIKNSGPLFVAAFYPLMLIVSAIAGHILLGEEFYLGSVVGSLIIVCGLYLVLWGKLKDAKSQSLSSIGEEEGEANETNNAEIHESVDGCRSKITND